MRTATLALLVAGITLAAAGAARADSEVTVRSEAAQIPAQGARRLSLDVPIGEVNVIATDGDQVEARLEVRCDRGSARCREKAANVRLRQERIGDELELEVAGFPKNNSGKSPHAHFEVLVPRGLAVTLELGVGEVEVSGVEGDLDVDLGVGEVRVEAPESAIGEVVLDVGVGEANLRPRPKGTRSNRFLFLGNEVEWDGGSGRASIEVEIGVGEADVELVP